MTADLEPYPDYKPSGVEWLGDVPAHWEMLPNRAVFAETNERNHPEEQMLSVTITSGVIRQKTLLEDSSKKDASRLDRSAYKLVCPGDIAYNKMRAWQGAVGVSEYKGIVSPAYVVQRPRSRACSRYLHYLLRTPMFAKEAERWSYGIAPDMWSLRPEHFKMIYSCVPPLAEQNAIVRYLDHVDGRIRRYIEAKEKLVALLAEEKQAVIQQAVTRGLDPNVRLKPSGVEWLGDVPAHWEVRRMRTVVFIRNGATPSTNNEAYWNGDILWITPEDLGAMKGRRITSSGRRITRAGYESCGASLVSPNSIAISTRAPIGHLGILGLAGCVNQGCKLLVPKGSIRSDFLYHVLETARPELQSRGHGTTFMELSRLKLGNFPLPVPPLAEQAAIAAYLDRETARIDAAAARARRQVELMREYRERLIADVVTGKLDVRAAAAALPDGGEA